jgi:hypothetical protein
MGTRSTIAIQNADGTVTGIYCHWDGYISCNGVILYENYNTEESVRELIALGDLSSLGETIGNKVDFNDYKSHKGQCVAYGRDRGEDNVQAGDYFDWTDLLINSGEEYNYLFVPGEGWRVRHHSYEGQLVDELPQTVS